MHIFVAVVSIKAIGNSVPRDDKFSFFATLDLLQTNVIVWFDFSCHIILRLRAHLKVRVVGKYN